jgi:hypothetical protein
MCHVTRRFVSICAVFGSAGGIVHSRIIAACMLVIVIGTTVGVVIGTTVGVGTVVTVSDFRRFDIAHFIYNKNILFLMATNSIV